MNYFSRLSDIVTCNLDELLAQASDPQTAILEIMREMQEGVAGAKRSVATAAASQQRLKVELDDHRRQVESWQAKARETLAADREEDARQALMRKREVEDLIGGLEQQQFAAVSTFEHLQTTLRALEARLAEATRRQQQLQEQPPAVSTSDTAVISVSEPQLAGSEAASTERRSQRDPKIEDELEALRRELGKDG